MKYIDMILEVNLLCKIIIAFIVLSPNYIHLSNNVLLDISNCNLSEIEPFSFINYDQELVLQTTRKMWRMFAECTSLMTTACWWWEPSLPDCFKMCKLNIQSRFENSCFIFIHAVSWLVLLSHVLLSLILSNGQIYIFVKA